ncbi:tyrosine-type recombinase/integrase [Robiginitalea sp. IMCC43444]|uniref:tyrosine-type recombinase/integrase n=1 Tax=Robiginitalea sp. IMCC43444 TaxID=3459121 RepID=UPI004041548B
MSLEQFRKYLSLEKKYASHTVTAYLRDLQQFEAFCSEEHEGAGLETLPYSVIRSWIIQLMETGLSNRSINRKVASLKSYYKYLMRSGLIESSPLAGHKPLKASKNVEVPFSVQEMQQLLEHWPAEDGFEGLRDKLVVELLYTSGMRRAELIGLKISDLDLSEGTVRVLGKRSKERIIPLAPSILPLIREYIDMRNVHFEGSEIPNLFLSNSGNKLYETLVYRIINKYLSEVSAKVKKSPHILRHTFATHMLNQGADMNSVKEILGHSSLASTQVYTHNSIAELKRIHRSAHPRNKK